MSPCEVFSATAASRAPRRRAPGRCTWGRSACGQAPGTEREGRAMGKRGRRPPEERWAEHQSLYRDPHQIAAQWVLAAEVDPELLRCEARGQWWQAQELRIDLGRQDPL